jgi:hypothetical protein
MGRRDRNRWADAFVLITKQWATYRYGSTNRTCRDARSLVLGDVRGGVHIAQIPHEVLRVDPLRASGGLANTWRLLVTYPSSQVAGSQAPFNAS